VLLVAVDPSRERYEQHLQRVEVGSHKPIVPCLTLDHVRVRARPNIRTLREE
jgi:hypothetical protein